MKRLWFTFLLLLTGLAFAQQSAPEIAFDSVPDFPKLPSGMNFGEVPGVAVNSQGHVFVFTRSNSASGPAYAPTAAQLLEFGPDGEFAHKQQRRREDRPHDHVFPRNVHIGQHPINHRDQPGCDRNRHDELKEAQ